jgi:hypothetical protein
MDLIGIDKYKKILIKKNSFPNEAVFDTFKRKYLNIKLAFEEWEDLWKSCAGEIYCDYLDKRAEICEKCPMYNIGFCDEKDCEPIKEAL